MSVTGYQNITALNTAKSLTVPGTTTQRAYIQPITQAVYFTLDGTTPSATNGLQLAAGKTMEIDGFLLSNVRLLEVAASATVKVMYVDGVGEITVWD